ncbi:unnamed protein product [Strongylus vulgaris]|uniref:Uncharacterized protein n=1 Tax=Strongylus vulgaris TaxID=40348 RepID=A0A3P7IU07_STRVU|nr:unnamed protein product [Strongylus vulgaris]
METEPMEAHAIQVETIQAGTMETEITMADIMTLDTKDLGIHMITHTNTAIPMGINMAQTACLITITIGLGKGLSGVIASNRGHNCIHEQRLPCYL